MRVYMCSCVCEYFRPKTKWPLTQEHKASDGNWLISHAYASMILCYTCCAVWCMWCRLQWWPIISVVFSSIINYSVTVVVANSNQPPYRHRHICHHCTIEGIYNAQSLMHVRTDSINWPMNAVVMRRLFPLVSSLFSLKRKCPSIYEWE